MCKMLMDMGHEVYLYASEGSTAPCTKLIVTHTLKDIRDSWGEGDNRFDIGYDWKANQFKHDFNLPQKAPATVKFYQNAITEINLNKKDDDFLLITQGTYQRPVDRGVGLYLTCESGIGYRGSYTRFRSWESSYIQNFTYGSENPRQSINGRYYDRVIPNYFDTKDFPFSIQKKDYFLFMGRMITRKGVFTAIETCEHIGVKLLLAGQLSDEISLDTLKKYPHTVFVGYADAKSRAELMGGARAVFTPTIYLEPFCGVHAEAMLCGTPVLTTNFGVFPDTVIDGVNGFKCDTLNDFVVAAKKVSDLDPRVIRKTAERFTLGEVSKQYQKWFDDLHQLYLSAKDPKIKGWHYIEPTN